MTDLESKKEAISIQAQYRLIEALSNSEARYSRLLDTLTEVVFSLDENDRFTLLNKAWYMHTGHAIKSSIGKLPCDFMPDEDALRWRSLSGSVEVKTELRLLNSDGDALWFLIYLTREHDRSIGTLTNIDAQKRAAEALIHTETRFRAVIENVAEVLFQMDSDLQLSFINPAWSDVIGYSEAETLGRPLSDFVVTEDKKLLLQCWERMKSGGMLIRQEFRLQCKDGAQRWMSLLLKGNQELGSIITGAMLDITEHKSAEDSLRVSEQRYALLSASTTDGVWDWDLTNDQVYFSSRWKQMLGYDDHELENTFSSWYQRVHEDDIQKAMDDVMACVEGRNAKYENIHRMRHRDGNWLWILDRGIVLRDGKGLPYRMIGSHSDVTTLKKTEEELKLREQEFNAVFDISPDGIVTFSESQKIQSVNTAFLGITGFALNELIGLSESEFGQLLEQISVKPENYAMTRSCGKKIYVFAPVYGAEIKQGGIRRADTRSDERRQKPPVFVLSLTERKIHNHAIAKIWYFRDISYESEVDQMKSQFLSTAAHELRTPMASIFGFSELLLSRDFDRETTREILTTIYQQSESLVAMLNQLLDLARIESRMGVDFSFLRQPLWPILRRAVAELLVQGDSRKVKSIRPKKEYQVDVDSDKLRQALTNAYKYSPHGGQITLSVNERSLSDGETEVGIVVRDKGLGMTAEQIEHVYDRFWRADDTGGIPGTGLGMSLVKEIMDVHQGRIEIKSQPKTGTTVSLWLPLHAGEH